MIRSEYFQVSQQQCKAIKRYQDPFKYPAMTNQRLFGYCYTITPSFNVNIALTRTSDMVIKANKLPETAGMATELEILNDKYPAKDHAKKVAEHIVKQGGDPKGVLYLEGQKLRMIEVGV